MIKVTLVGTGNVSSHLEKVFSNTEGIQLQEVLSSRGNAISKALQKSPLEAADVYIIAVSDDAISTVSKQFSASKKLIVHTSGSVAMNAIPQELRKGVFYPLQTFSKGSDLSFKTIPLCIEAAKNEDFLLLKKVADAISDAVYEISSEQRKSLHLAAVYINNFTNHLYHIGQELCEQHQVPFDILKPLIAETAKKIETTAPFDAQTGPARRNDAKTIDHQLARLENKNHRLIYQALTESILKTYGKKL